MKKCGILNAPIAAVVAEMGHFDTITVADAGLPIPQEVERIDLVVRPGLPAFVDVVAALLDELAVQEAVIAEEMLTASPALHAEMHALLGPDVPIRTVPHDEFKRLTHASRAVVRSGECTPYANVILVAGVVF